MCVQSIAAFAVWSALAYYIHSQSHEFVKQAEPSSAAVQNVVGGWYESLLTGTSAKHSHNTKPTVQFASVDLEILWDNYLLVSQT